MSHIAQGEWCILIRDLVSRYGFSIFQKLTDLELQRYYVEANLAVRLSGKHNFEYCRFPVPSPWNISRLEEVLCEYHDKEIVQFIKYGWPIDLMHVPHSVPYSTNPGGSST